MTPREKWERMRNPKELGDYGLGLTEEELRTFPEGRAFLLEVRLVQRFERNVDRIARRFFRSMSLRLDEIVASVLRDVDGLQ